jgi:hypothetical protein
MIEKHEYGDALIDRDTVGEEEKEMTKNTCAGRLTDTTGVAPTPRVYLTFLIPNAHRAYSRPAVVV